MHTQTRTRTLTHSHPPSRPWTARRAPTHVCMHPTVAFAVRFVSAWQYETTCNLGDCPMFVSEYCSSTLQQNATRCKTMQHAATHCNTLQHTEARCNTMQHAATQCTIRQHTMHTLQHNATRGNTLHCNSQRDGHTLVQSDGFFSLRLACADLHTWSTPSLLALGHTNPKK